MRRFLTSLRTGAYLTRERVRLWALALLAGAVVMIGFFAVTAHGLNGYDGQPLGTDFSNIYAAGLQANAGRAADIYVPAKHAAAERSVFGAHTPLYGWHYPPFLLLIAAPLARLPYLAALFVWQAVTLALYLGAMALLLKNTAAPLLLRDRLWPLLAIAFPAVLANLLAGHNGFLTAALLAGALAMLDKRPLVAGILFGLLAYKPQFGLMIPLVLMVTGRWRTIGAGAFAVAMLSVACTVLYGTEIWSAFAGSAQFTRTVVLEDGSTGFYKIQSIFAWVRMWGGSVSLAYALQGAVTAGAGAGLWRLWRSPAALEIKAAALCIASVLATPYSLDYDLMALAPAIALFAVGGQARGFAPYEKSALAALWLAPFFARVVPHATFIPVTVPVMLAAFTLLLRHAMRPDAAPRGANLSESPYASA